MKAIVDVAEGFVYLVRASFNLNNFCFWVPLFSFHITPKIVCKHALNLIYGSFYFSFTANKGDQRLTPTFLSFSVSSNNMSLFPVTTASVKSNTCPPSHRSETTSSHSASNSSLFCHPNAKSKSKFSPQH